MSTRIRCISRFPQRMILRPYVFATLTLVPLSGRAAETTAWHTGSEFRKALQVTTSVNWQQISWRNALTSLSRNHRVAILLDRRIDPDQPIDFSASELTLDDLLKGLASHLQIGVCYLEPVVYFGPRHVTAKLPTLAALRTEELRKLPDAARRRLSQVRPWQWEELSEPSVLLGQLAAESSVTVKGWDRIPHDLWPAVRLPPLSLTDRLTLVLAGFDLTFTISPDASTFELVEMPQSVVLQRSYAAGTNPRDRAAELARLFPQAQVRLSGLSIVVNASLEDHDAMEQLLAGKTIKRTAVTGGRTVHSLTVEGKPVGAILNAIATQLNWEVTFEPAIHTKLNETVSFTVTEVTTEELLDAVLKPVGLSFQLEGSRLILLPAPP